MPKQEQLADYKLLSVVEVADRFGRDPSTVLNWIASKLLRAVPVPSTHGRRDSYVIPEDALDGFSPPDRGALSHKKKRRLSRSK